MPSGYEFTWEAGHGLRAFKSPWERCTASLARAAGAEVTVTTTAACTDERKRVRRQLEQYFGRATERMVWIVEALRNLAD